MAFDVRDLPEPLIRYGVGLWRRRWLIVAAAWAAALLGWAGLWLIPDKYESRAQVFVQTETILEPVMTGVTARPNYERRVEVMRQQLLTRPNVEEVVFRSGLDRTIRARSDLERRVKMETLVDWVAGEIKIDSPQEMYFNISYRHNDREIARDVVDAVVNLLIEQDLGASLEEKEEARRLLDAQIARFDERLTAKEQEVAAFRRQHASELVVVEGDRRQREQREADLARIGEEIALEQRRIATLQSLIASTPATTSGDEADRLKVQLAELRSQYEESYPDIQNILARIKELERGSGGAPSNPEHRRLAADLAAAQAQIEALKSREARLRADAAALAVAAGEAPAVAADLQRIVRDYEQTQKSYEELVARRDRLALTASLGAGGEGVEYKIFERPTAALRPVAPPRLALILGAFALALAAGAGLAAALTWIDKTYTQTDELANAFGLPVLGSVSPSPSALTTALRRKDAARLGAAGLALAAACGFYLWWEVLRLPGEAGAGAQTASLVSIRD